jgi:hypothetical protein
MNERRNVRWAATVAAVALLGCAVAWADEDTPRPDSVADDVSNPRILVLDRKGGPPGPIELPRPIQIKPVGDAFGSGNRWNNVSGAFSGPVGGPGGATTTQIETSLEKVADKLQ